MVFEECNMSMKTCFYHITCGKCVCIYLCMIDFILWTKGKHHHVTHHTLPRPAWPPHPNRVDKRRATWCACLHAKTALCAGFACGFLGVGARCQCFVQGFVRVRGMCLGAAGSQVLHGCECVFFRSELPQIFLWWCFIINKAAAR